MNCSKNELDIDNIHTLICLNINVPMDFISRFRKKTSPYLKFTENRIRTAQLPNLTTVLSSESVHNTANNISKVLQV